MHFTSMTEKEIIAASARLLMAAILTGCEGTMDISSHPVEDSDIDVIDRGLDTSCYPGLVAWWPAENDALDATPNHLDADIHFNSRPFADGQHGRAFSFDGINDYHRVVYDPSLYPTASFSIEAWIRTADPSATIISLYECGGTCVSGVSGATVGLNIFNGTIEFRVRDDAGRFQLITSAATINDGAYHHVVAVRNVEDRLFKIFIDGQLDTSATLTAIGRLSASADGDADPFTIGASRQPASSALGGYLAGEVDELSYYLRALSPAEVAELASNGKCRP